jgi:hypothetical protein
MRGGAGGDHAPEIAGYDNLGGGAAYTGLRSFSKRIYAARPHEAVPATDSQLSESAARFLLFGSIPYGFDPLPACFRQQTINSAIHAFFFHAVFPDSLMRMNLNLF